MRGRARRRADRGTGLVGSVFGLLVTMLLMALAVQVMLGLYATSTLRATVYDAAARAANRGATSAADLDRLAHDAELSLGAMGERTDISLHTEDTDGDGLADVVVGTGAAVPPRVVPRSIGGMVGFEQVRAGARVRIERVR